MRTLNDYLWLFLVGLIGWGLIIGVRTLWGG